MGERVTTAELSALRDRRWTGADARQLLRSWRASGMSMSAFGAKHGIAAQRLGWWKKRLADWGEGGAIEVVSSPQLLVPAVVRSSAVIPEAAAVAVLIRLPAGVVLEVADTAAVDPAWIAAVAGALSRPA